MVFGCIASHQHEICIETALDQAHAICHEKGARLTHIRHRILELIWRHHKPQKAYDLLSDFQKEDPAAKPATIYRALDFLMAHHLIHKIDHLNAYIGCVEPNTDMSYILFVCTECENVKETIDHSFNHSLKEVGSHYGFECHHRTFEIKGICQNCH